MIIPLNNPTTYLIFQNVYEALLHGGPQLILPTRLMIEK